MTSKTLKLGLFLMGVVLLAGCRPSAPPADHTEPADSPAPMAAPADTPVEDADTPAVRPILVDVRSPEEYAGGHLAGAILLPHTETANRAAELFGDKDAPLAVYCKAGIRAENARQTLESLGYTNVTNLGGIDEAARKLDVPIVTDQVEQ